MMQKSITQFKRIKHPEKISSTLMNLIIRQYTIHNFHITSIEGFYFVSHPSLDIKYSTYTYVIIT
jgi:hypothetical protein